MKKNKKRSKSVRDAKEKPLKDYQPEYLNVKNAVIISQEKHTWFKMAEYVCYNCNEKLGMEDAQKVRCPYCGSKILIKKRPKITKIVKAR